MGARLNVIQDTWEWGKYAGVGVYTGEAAKLVALDFDHPENCQIYSQLPPSFCIWHGDGSPEEVLAGKKRGAVLYKVPGEWSPQFRTTKKAFLDKYGFEFIAGGKTVQVFGLHPDNEFYQYDGNLAEMTPDLQKLLLHMLPKKRKTKPKDTSPGLFDLEPKDKGQFSEETQQYEATDKEIEGVKWIVEKVLPNHELFPTGSRMVGRCPFEDEHGTQGHETHFNIFFTPSGLPFAKCFHTSCEASINELNQELRKAFEEWKKLTVRDTKVKKIDIPKLDKPEPNSIREALRSDSRFMMVLSPTGSGKTYESALLILECIKAQKPIIYVAGNRTDQEAIKDLIEELSGKKTEELFLQILRGGSRVEEEIASDGSVKISESTLAIVTHRTYLLRKGISTLFFNVLKWIRESKAFVIIDECDNYLTALSNIIDIGGRYICHKAKGAEFSTFRYRSVCPAFDKSGSCEKCYYIQSQIYMVNTHNIPELEAKLTIDEREIGKQEKLVLPHINFTKEAQIEEMTIKQIEKHPTFLERKRFNFALPRDEYHKFDIAFKDMIESSFCPVVYKALPRYKEKPILPQDITEDIKKEVVYSYTPCNVPHVSLKDVAPLVWLRDHAKKIRFLTATIGPTNKEFVKTIIPALEIKELKTSEQKIGELLIVGVKEKLKYTWDNGKSIMFEGLQDFGRVLVFEPKKSKAESLFKKLPSSFPCSCFITDSEYQPSKFVDETKKTLITYSRGPLGRAINLPKFYFCFASSLIFKPAIAYDLDVFTTEQLEIRKQEERWFLVLQNFGRILRGEGRKVLVLSHCEPNTLEWLKLELTPMVAGQIKTTIFEKDHKAVKTCLLHYMETGEVKNEEKTAIKKAVEEGTTNLSKTDRAKVKGELQEKRQEDKENDIKGKIEQAAKEMLSWTDTRNKHHLSRLDPAKGEELKQLFEIARTKAIELNGNLLNKLKALHSMGYTWTNARKKLNLGRLEKKEQLELKGKFKSW
jgi:hypothetical protein